MRFTYIHICSRAVVRLEFPRYFQVEAREEGWGLTESCLFLRYWAPQCYK